jgi:hypothetical protein
MALPITGAPDSTPTVCPDPADERLQVAGPVVADKFGTPTRSPSHNLYIPFVRGTLILPGLTAGPPYDLYVARSTNGGDTWTRHLVAHLGAHNPINIFPQLTIDRGGNLYYTWSQTQGPGVGESGLLGEQDVYFATSTWGSPVNLTKERNDTAIFPWMVAGDPGRVDLVMYKANTGINSNFAFVDAEGNECEEGDPGCAENPSAWNVYFSQSLNALNSSPNFKTVQISAAPNYIGQACTLGLACEGDRDLLDFFTVDVDHLGAAVVAYSDDNSALLTRDHTTRQIAATQCLQKPEHHVAELVAHPRPRGLRSRRGRLRHRRLPQGLLPRDGRPQDHRRPQRQLGHHHDDAQLGADRAGRHRVRRPVRSGGVWGAEFWARTSDEPEGAHHFYIAYRDDLTGGPRVEGGAMDNINVAITSLDFQARTPGTLSGTCLPSAGPPAATECTIAMTVNVSALGITPGNALLSLTGVSAHFFGHDEEAPFTRVLLGNSEQADATAALHVLGSGTL